MKIVIKDDTILAVHTDDQDVSLTDYPSATEIKTVVDTVEPYKDEIQNEGTESEMTVKVFKTVTELALTTDDEKTVRIIDGGKISGDTLTALTTASTVEELRTIISTILTGEP